MIEINLLPKELEQKKDFNWTTRVFIAFCWTAFSLGIGIWLAQWWQINQGVQQLRQIENNLASVSFITQDFARWEEEKKKTQLQEQWRASLEQEKVRADSFLVEVAAAVPEDAWLTKLACQGSKLTLEGKGISYQSLVDFLNNLKESNYFQGEPTLANSQNIFIADAISLVSFEIRGQLKIGNQK